MLKRLQSLAFLALVLSLGFAGIPARAQLGNSGSIEGVVKDASGGVVEGARIEVANAVSRFRALGAGAVVGATEPRPSLAPSRADAALDLPGPGTGCAGRPGGRPRARLRRASGLGPGDRIAVDRGRAGPRGCRERAASRALGARRGLTAFRLHAWARACRAPPTGDQADSRGYHRPYNAGAQPLAARSAPPLVPAAGVRHGATSHPDEAEPESGCEDPGRLRAGRGRDRARGRHLRLDRWIGRHGRKRGSTPARRATASRRASTTWSSRGTRSAALPRRRGSRSPGWRSSTPSSTPSSFPRRDAWTWCPTGARCSPTGVEARAPASGPPPGRARSRVGSGAGAPLPLAGGGRGGRRRTRAAAGPGHRLDPRRRRRRHAPRLPGAHQLAADGQHDQVDDGVPCPPRAAASTAPGRAALPSDPG